MEAQQKGYEKFFVGRGIACYAHLPIVRSDLSDLDQWVLIWNGF
jgi:hypothetical protein